VNGQILTFRFFLVLPVALLVLSMAFLSHGRTCLFALGPLLLLLLAALVKGSRCRPPTADPPTASSRSACPMPGSASAGMRFLISSLVFWFLLPPGARMATAQQPAQVSRELLLFMEVPTVVTAARKEQPITKAPATISIITAEEIRQSGATNIPDLFRSVPGLDFFRTSASDVNITARGLNTRVANRMQVFIDGRSVYEDFFNMVFWHQLPVSLEEIERIEIVKSPASALFGANAFSGIIHIITKSPETLKGTHVSGTGGDFDTGIGNLIHAGVENNVGYKISLGYHRTNHFPNPLIGRTDDKKGREDLRGNFLVEYKLGERSQASLSGGIDSFDRDIDPGFGLIFAEGGLGFAKLKYSFADLKFQFVWSRLDTDLRSTIFPEEGSVLADTYQADVQHSFNLGKKNVLTGGAGYRFNTFESPLLIGQDREQNLFAVFLQDELSPLEDLTFTVGVRVDTHPETGVNVSPRGSVVYSPWRDHTFRVSVGRAFRNPSILESFISLDALLPPPPATVKILGNRDLDPEEITSYEFGYQAFLFRRLKARIDLFYNQIDQFIDSPEPTGPLELTILNREDGSIFGGEFSLEFLLAEWLQGFFNYSYQERKVDLRSLGIAPHHKGNAGLNFSLKHGFSANVFVHHVGESEGFPGKVNPYTLVNVRLGYRFKVLGNEAEIALAAFNLFNDMHREIPGGDLIERRVSGTVRYRF